MSRARVILGQWGEDLAADYLTAHGYQLLERNVRTPYGEIDLIARREERLIFVEVKTRSSTQFGYPESGLTPQKQSHLLAAIDAYFQEHSELACDWQVDVIAVRQFASGRRPEIVHFENALS